MFIHWLVTFIYKWKTVSILFCKVTFLSCIFIYYNKQPLPVVYALCFIMYQPLRYKQISNQLILPGVCSSKCFMLMLTTLVNQICRTGFEFVSNYIIIQEKDCFSMTATKIYQHINCKLRDLRCFSSVWISKTTKIMQLTYFFSVLALDVHWSLIKYYRHSWYKLAYLLRCHWVCRGIVWVITH